MRHEVEARAEAAEAKLAEETADYKRWTETIMTEYRLMQAKVKRLEEALRPFANVGGNIGNSEIGLEDEAEFREPWCYNLTFGDLRRARAALEG